MNVRVTRNLKTDLYGHLTTKEVYEVNDDSFDVFMKKGWAVVTEKPATISFYKLRSGGIRREIKAIEKRIAMQTVKVTALNKDREKRADAKVRIQEEHQPKIDKLLSELETLNENSVGEELVTVSEKKMDRAKKLTGKSTKKSTSKKTEE